MRTNVANVGSSGAWVSDYTEYYYFWGEGPFSQWSYQDFVIEDVRYDCNEQWMMSEKAKFFGDMAMYARILGINHDARECKRLGKLVANFSRAPWSEVAREIVTKGQIAKFQQNPAALVRLKETAGCLLVEASPSDKIWGIGLSIIHAERGDVWNGTNWLGEVLTKVREQLCLD